eukprot:3455013-Pyramimonas_sp.AAC.1
MPMRRVSPLRVSPGTRGSQMPMRRASPLRDSTGSTGSQMPMRSVSTPPFLGTVTRGAPTSESTEVRRYLMRHGGDAPEGGLE